MDTGDLLANEHLKARGMVASVEHPARGRFEMPGMPIKMGATPDVEIKAAPLLGEHTEEVLREIGLGDAEIDECRREKIV